MQIECSRCPRVWDHPGKILTNRSLRFHLAEDGWTQDMGARDAWLCPECSEELELSTQEED